MDWGALNLSLRLALWTCVLLLPLALFLGRYLAAGRGGVRSLISALVTLPLVLPPTVLGYYLLLGFGVGSPLADLYRAITGGTLVFSFEGLVLASVLFNLPFAVQPLVAGFRSVAPELREAAWCSGLSRMATLLRIELPLVWPSLAAALVLTFVHTLGEFGVVLMVGGNIPGETRTAAIAIYDHMQSFEDAAAGRMAALLLALSFVGVILVNRLSPERRANG